VFWEKRVNVAVERLGVGAFIGIFPHTSRARRRGRRRSSNSSAIGRIVLFIPLFILYSCDCISRVGDDDVPERNCVLSSNLPLRLPLACRRFGVTPSLARSRAADLGDVGNVDEPATQ
jgi:hypothetical protein